MEAPMFHFGKLSATKLILKSGVVPHRNQKRIVREHFLRFLELQMTAERAPSTRRPKQKTGPLGSSDGCSPEAKTSNQENCRLRGVFVAMMQPAET